MAFKPTKAQQSAIDTDGNILVSAAAGSGKTAVLVERVIKKLCNKENPTRADELLIVTFTNAAAAEMRSRIEKRLDEECKKNPQDAGLLLQKHLLNSAKICTIDSFCIDLVRENFDKSGISPDFKIGEETDLKAINEQVLYSILNRYFEEKNPLFLELLDIVGSEFDEKNFTELIFSVYNYSRQLPFPKKWYTEILSNYGNGSFTPDNLWYKYAFDKAKSVISSMERSIDNALEMISTVDDAQKAYNTVFMDAKEKIQTLRETADLGEWDTFYEALENYSLLKLPIIRGLGEYELISAAKDIYKHLSGKALDSLYKLFYADSSFINKQFKKLYPSIELFVKILNEFEDALFEAYNEENIFTFHNTEHLALELLCEEKNGEIFVSENGKELLGHYKEVMVDEYQDTNDLQDKLFYVLSEYDKKLFVVGDIKQSIYAFRGANPENFLRKKQNYIPLEQAKDGKAQKIILGNNYRSKEQICEFVNFFFGLFMQKETGNIVYDSEEMLVPASKFPDCETAAVSFDLIDRSETDVDAITLEARSIAAFIKDTINGAPCIKVDDNTLRKANYGDFTILLRSVANKAPALVNELKLQGIPVNLNTNNFTESIEISTFLSLLKVIDNPKNDIALACVLMSPIFRFTADKLAEIRLLKKDGDLYSALIYAANNDDAMAADFLAKIENFRIKSVTMPLGRLILMLLIETEYLNIVSSLSGGEQRRNNLLLLCDLANQFVNEKSRSVSSFVDYVLKLSSVSGVSSTNDAVNIMSVHASKGLQFPICIIASASSRFNDVEARSGANFSTKFGIGFKYYDETDTQKYTTISREVILDDVKSTSLEEELRLLYVAMTRAQDKLHFVSSFSNLEKSVANYKNLLASTQSNIDNSLFVRTKSYTDWLMVALLLHPKCKGDLCGCGDASNDFNINSPKLRIINGLSLESFNQTSESVVEDTVDQELVTALCDNFNYKYPYEALIGIQSKMSVSVLANKAESDKYAFTSKPAFMSADGITATGRGTAMHKVMEFFDFSKTENIAEEIERLYEWQFITETERDSLDKNALIKFFKSDIFNRIKNADRVEREMRFLTEIPALEIDKNLKLDLGEEKIVIQGAVDICFIENGEIVILDFKTDRVGDLSELALAYGDQLSAYAKACEKIFGLKVKEKLIYSFSKSDTVQIK